MPDRRQRVRTIEYVLAGLIAVAVLLWLLIARPQGTDSSAGKVGTSSVSGSPNFTLQNLEGRTVSLTDFSGKVVIVDFWASWCGPCLVQIPYFIELYDKYKNRGFEMIGIAVDSGRSDAVKAFVRERSVNYTILMDDEQTRTSFGGLRGMPTTFVIDRSGRVYKKYVGYRDKEVFEADIKSLLSASDGLPPIKEEGQRMTVVENHKHTNRLIGEKSPYLLQHAHNPVDWYPWGKEAFEKAKKESKPIFLSIGYSTCHWCHVMEHESFSDEEVAAIMNQYFVSIKVDREERPDIDNIYMSVCQAMTGGGGWPLTIIMTPEQKPFFAGTYFPKQGKWGRPGLMDTLKRIAESWENDRDGILESSERIVQAVQSRSDARGGGELTGKVLEKGYSQLGSRFDKIYGGFGSAPKFPSPHNLSFLLRWWKRSGDGMALAMVEKTLDSMDGGGIHDHVGYGFHRYSTDRTWLVPHFEKMLYDQAMLAIAHVETYQAGGKERYAEVAQKIFTYVLRDMTSPAGGFYSAEDADSEGEEGKFYVWTPKEIKGVLGEKTGDIFCRFYGVTRRGNFEGGRSILHIGTPVDEFARRIKMDPAELRNVLEESIVKLFAEREKRIHPLKDDKILTDWNGLMIVALAKGAQALNRPEYARAAARAADFILEELRRPDGRLVHRFRDGEAALPGYVDDYAFLVWGLIELYEATFEVRYLQEALALNNEMLQLFWDEKDGGLFFTGQGNEELISRSKKIYDGAIPSGNSVAASNLLRLGRMTANRDLKKKAEQLMSAFSGEVSGLPMAHSQFLSALDFAIGPSKEIVIAGEQDEEDTRNMLRAVSEQFLPRKVLIFHPGGGEGEKIESIAEFVKQQRTIDGKATAYVCENYTCKLPTTSVAKMKELLRAESSDR